VDRQVVFVDGAFLELNATLGGESHYPFPGDLANVRALVFPQSGVDGTVKYVGVV
jgi:hypothetical protein